MKRERFFARIYLSNETVSQTTVSTGPMKCFVWGTKLSMFVKERWHVFVTWSACLTNLTTFFRVLEAWCHCDFREMDAQNRPVGGGGGGGSRGSNEPPLDVNNGGLKTQKFFDQGLERFPHLRPPISDPPSQTPHLRPPISGPPSQTPHLRPLISGPPSRAPISGPRSQTPHLRPPMSGPLFQTL